MLTPHDRDDTHFSLNAIIEVMNLAKETGIIVPAKTTFGSVSVILITIKVSFSLSSWCWSQAESA